MVYDCFTFFDEIELLEFRLRHLWDVVDVFVICESNLTFSGQAKELYFANNSGRFEWARAKIKHVVCDELIPNASPNERWQNEVRQRNHLSEGLKDAKTGDIVIMGDVDEFPSVDAIEYAIERLGNYVCLQRPHCYFLDRAVNSFVWHGCSIVRYSGIDPQEIRENRTSGKYEAIPDAGWHFSYLGGIEAIQKKLSSFSHAEFDIPEFHDIARLWRDMSEDRIFLDGVALSAVDDFELPRIMFRTRESHPHLFHPVDRRQPPKIYDCFMFWKELDVLELRLRHLYDHVDKFVIVEAPFSFTGKPKPLYFWENRERFAWAMDKIEHVLVDFQPSDSAWWNESAQRNNIENGLSSAKPGDIVMVSDVDELPNIDVMKEACKWIRHNDCPATLTLEKCYYKLNNFMTGHEPGTDAHAPWNMFVMCMKKHLNGRWRPQILRDAHNSLYNFSPKGGWHFSFMGDSDIITEKIQAFSHTEYDTPDIIQKLSDKITKLNEDVFDRGFTFTVKEIVPGLLPDYVTENLEYYRDRGFIA